MKEYIEYIRKDRVYKIANDLMTEGSKGEKIMLSDLVQQVFDENEDILRIEKHEDI